MSWPSDLPVRNCSVGSLFQLEGGTDYSATATIKASRSDLTWSTTGQAAFSAPRTLLVDLGAEALLTLPCTDADGWLLNGLPVTLEDGQHVFTYDITISVKDGAKIIGTRTYKGVAIPTGDGTLDIDKATTVASTSGALVTVPNFVSDMQATVDTAIEQLQATAEAPTAEAMATWLADPDSPVQKPLKATFGRLTSTDGTVLTGLGTLPEPTGVGVELVFTADGLDDIRINGVSA